MIKIPRKFLINQRTFHLAFHFQIVYVCVLKIKPILYEKNNFCPCFFFFVNYRL